MSVKAVVFDFGQVISFPQDPKTIDKLAERAGVERNQFESVFLSLRGEYDRGVLGAREYFRNVLSRLGAAMDDKGVDEMIAIDSDSWKNINPGTTVLMEDVKKAGYTLGILSNMPHEFLAWARTNVPAFSLPHISLFSCELKLIKPDEAIFRKLISAFGVKPEELVFFDDNAENISSAKVLGIEAFLWKDPEAARRELLSLGVRL